MTLHITNGDIIADRLRTIGMEGYILPWREVLHEGTLADYQSVDVGGRRLFNQDRAAYIGNRGWADAKTVFDEMNRRDEMLLDPHWKEIVIWVENDLFDQLILAQVLTLLYRTGRFQSIDVRLVDTTKHLNYRTDSELVYAGRTPQTLTRETITPYLEFWRQVTHDDTSSTQTPAPAPLQVARRQWLELQPGDDGLSTFDRRILTMIERRGSVPIDVLFQQINAEEGDAAFWGDTPFIARIMDLTQKVPSLCFHDNVVEYHH